MFENLDTTINIEELQKELKVAFEGMVSEKISKKQKQLEKEYKENPEEVIFRLERYIEDLTKDGKKNLLDVAKLCGTHNLKLKMARSDETSFYLPRYGVHQKNKDIYPDITYFGGTAGGRHTSADFLIKRFLLSGDEEPKNIIEHILYQDHNSHHVITALKEVFDLTEDEVQNFISDIQSVLQKQNNIKLPSGNFPIVFIPHEGNDLQATPLQSPKTYKDLGVFGSYGKDNSAFVETVKSLEMLQKNSKKELNSIKKSGSEDFSVFVDEMKSLCNNLIEHYNDASSNYISDEFQNSLLRIDSPASFLVELELMISLIKEAQFRYIRLFDYFIVSGNMTNISHQLSSRHYKLKASFPSSNTIQRSSSYLEKQIWVLVSAKQKDGNDFKSYPILRGKPYKDKMAKASDLIIKEQKKVLHDSERRILVSTLKSVHDLAEKHILKVESEIDKFFEYHSTEMAKRNLNREDLKAPSIMDVIRTSDLKDTKLDYVRETIKGERFKRIMNQISNGDI